MNHYETHKGGEPGDEASISHTAVHVLTDKQLILCSLHERIKGSVHTLHAVIIIKRV